MSTNTVGTLLMVAAMAVLLLDPGVAGYLKALHFGLFLSLFVLGGLMLLGLLGIPDRVAALRRSGLPPVRAMRSVPNAARCFARPGMSAGTQLLLALLCGGLVVLGLMVVWGWPGEAGDAWLLASPLLVFGPGLALYLGCHQRQRVEVSPTALHLRGCRRKVIVWDDVIALHGAVPAFAGSPIGQMFTLYSRRDSLRVVGKLEQRKQLMAVIAEATGLDWS